MPVADFSSFRIDKHEIFPAVPGQLVMDRKVIVDVPLYLALKSMGSSECSATWRGPAQIINNHRYFHSFNHISEKVY